MRLHLTAVQHAELHPYLFDVRERIAFLFLSLQPGGAAPGDNAHVGDVRLLEPGDYLHRDQHYVELAAGVSAKARDVTAARALVSFLAGPAVSPTLAAKGMEKP